MVRADGVFLRPGQEDADAAAEAIFAAGLEAELVDDGALAQSLEQAAAFWHLREMMSEVQKLEGGSIKHDVAVPLARVPELIARASAAVAEMIPGVRPCPFGHMGDGNIHLNFSQPVAMDKAAFLARWDEVNARRPRHRRRTRRHDLGRARHRRAEARHAASRSRARSRST